MVWGMKPPETFGEFWPDGEFKGWSANLMGHYLKQPPEVQRELFDGRYEGMEAAANYPYYVSQKFINGVGTEIRPDDAPFTAVQPHEAPRCFVTEKSYSELGALIELNDRILAVDEALKTIVEQLEPGVHQFFPIEIKTSTGEVYPKPFYSLVIGQYLDSFAPNESKEKSWRVDGPDYYFYDKSKIGISGLALSKRVFGGAHLWRESRMSSQLNCFSNQLKTEMEQAGLRTPSLYQMIEI